MALIVDTGPILALMDASDRDHERCVALLSQYEEELVVPAPVLVEVDYWLNKYFGPAVACRFLENVARGSLAVADLVPPDYRRVLQLCLQYADTPIGFVDAAVFAVAERLEEPKLATLDRRYFGMMRPRHVAALTLLP